MTPPRKLYRYESWNEHSLANLKNQQLYFSDPRSFNDPFDCTIDFRLSAMTEADFQRLHTYFLETAPYKNEFKRKFGEAYTDDFKEVIITVMEERLKDAADLLFSSIGVACFSELNNEILMWSHYSRSHTGFCLEFDTAYEPFNKAMKVEYEDLLPQINPAKILSDRNLLEPIKLLRTKYNSWKYEKEWRVIHKEKNKLFGYPAESLTGVYFGAKIDFAHLEIIALILRGQNPDVALYKGSKSKTEFIIDFERVLYTPYVETKIKGLA